MSAGHTAQDLATVDRDFRAGRLQLTAPPTRFYVNLTERCNVRCRHCITHAPRATRSGAARDLGPEVLAALTPHLAHAAYLGLAHAGEPLIAPQLSPLLRALRAQRAGEPTVVHLLTNGLGLSVERFETLVALGVTSWSFSVDGMSAATHDALRVGSRIARLLARIEEIADRARALGDVRLGVAWTVTRSNLHEVERLLHFAAAARLHWVKLEELFPVNAAAAAEEVRDPAALADAVTRAHAVARSLGVPLLDHTGDIDLFPCQLDSDPVARAFSALDSRANRLAINPCRLPWELCCVEPDGAVRPVSFHWPVAGNLLERDLLELWNQGSFVEAREQHLRRRLCSELPTCPPDNGPAQW